MTDTLDERLVSYLKDAHAMERQVLRSLDGMIATTDDPQVRRDLEHHKEETERHLQSLEERLHAHGTDPSTIKEVAGMAAALLKGMVDIGRGEKPAKNARDGFVTEHLEIAAYELLERFAQRAGDTETVEVARRNRADEEAMAQKIAGSWDKVVALTLAEEGVTAPVGAAH